MPGQQVVKPRSRMVCNAAQHVGEPGLWVDIVEFGRADQRVDRSGMLTAAIGAGKQPSFAAECNAAQRALGRVVGQADAAVVEEASEGRPNA